MGKQAVNKTTAAADAKAAKAEEKAVAKVAKKMTGVVYNMTKKVTDDTPVDTQPEVVIKVMPHTFNTGYVLFAKAELEGTDEWATVAEADMFRFENPNNDGKLTSETYDIEVAPVESETKTEDVVADVAAEDKYKGMKIVGRTILSSRLKDVHGRMLTEITLDTGETMLFSTEELEARLSPEN